MSSLVRYRYPAMATLFEAVLLGDPAESRSIAETLFEEIDRIEGLLSRFDSSSEVARINRNASREPVRTSCELMDLLTLCRGYWEKTGGAFDPAGCLPDRSSHFGQVELDPTRRTIRFNHPDPILDFGGVGKGYALLRCREILRELGVANALVHGGTSSVLAMGEGPGGEGWPVALRTAEGSPPILLRDQSLSTSAVESENRVDSDIVDPIRRTAPNAPRACTVIGEDPLSTEILSTAFLVMGQEGAETYLENSRDVKIRVVWSGESTNRPGLGMESDAD